MKESSNIIFDSDNNRIGINTSTPATDLEVIGTTKFSGGNMTLSN